MPALLDRPARFLPSAPYSYRDPDSVGRGVIHLVGGRVEDFLWEDEEVEELRRRLEKQQKEIVSLQRPAVSSAQRVRLVSLFASFALVLILWSAAFFAPVVGGPSPLFYVAISLPLLGVAVASALALSDGRQYDEED